MNRAHEDQTLKEVKRTCKMEMCISKGTPFSIPPHDSVILMMQSERVLIIFTLSRHNVYSTSKQSKFMM